MIKKMKKQSTVTQKLNGHIFRKILCCTVGGGENRELKPQRKKREVEFSHVQSIFAWIRQPIVTGQQGLLEIRQQDLA